MRTCLRFAPVVVAFWLVAAARGAESKTIVLGDDKGIVVRLTYLTEATLADAEFLKLEFENTTGKPVPLGHGLFYDIKYESSDAVGGMAAEWPGFIGGRRHHAPRAVVADEDGLASQFRVVTLFDRRKEGVHVEVED